MSRSFNGPVKSSGNTFNEITGGGWSGDTFTGTAEQSRYSYLSVNLQVDEGGTLFFDFSQDNVNFSTFPVAGFPVASGINEVHSAYKFGYRYFRVRFVGTGGRSYFRLLTEYSQNPVILNSPLSQGVTSDQDASTVKAILHGENGDTGTFVQQKFTDDGAALVSSDSSIINFSYDAYDKTVVDTVTDRFDYFTGGLAGTKVADITVVYEDSSKINAISAVRTNV